MLRFIHGFRIVLGKKSNTCRRKYDGLNFRFVLFIFMEILFTTLINVQKSESLRESEYIKVIMKKLKPIFSQLN